MVRARRAIISSSELKCFLVKDEPYIVSSFPFRWIDLVSDQFMSFRLDTIGLAGFSHDFGSLDGKPASVTKIFDSFGSSSKRSKINVDLLLFAQVFPILSYVPTPRKRMLHEMQEIMEDISNTLLERTKNEKEKGALDGKEEKSIVGVLSKSFRTDLLGPSYMHVIPSQGQRYR